MGLQMNQPLLSMNVWPLIIPTLRRARLSGRCSQSRYGSIAPSSMRASPNLPGSLPQTPPSWQSSYPPFKVLVHSPTKRTTSVGSAYTVYSVSSIFPDESVPHITVYRRFSQFSVLYTVLRRRLPGVALPPLPGELDALINEYE